MIVGLRGVAADWFARCTATRVANPGDLGSA